MLKIGDIVEITAESSATGMLDFVEGKGYKVERLSYYEFNSTGQPYRKDESLRLVNESGVTGWYSASHFKLKEGAKVKSNENHFKVGQTVWDVMYGKGEVVNILQNVLKYHVVVKFADCKRSFTEDGKSDENHARTLFFSEPKIEAATEPLFEPVLKKGDWVVLSDNTSQAIVKVVNETDFELFYEGDGVVSGVFKNTVDVYRLGEKIKFN